MRIKPCVIGCAACSSLLLISSVYAADFRLVQPDIIGAPAVFSAAWADYDGDGDLDLAAALKSGEVRLYRNDQGKFAGVGAASGLPIQGDSATALSWGDYDSDGYPDLYVGVLGKAVLGRNLLFHNEGGRRFSEVAAKVGVDFPGVSSRQANWIDYDNDGDLDLFVANRIGGNALFRNDGGAFTSVAAASGLADPRRSVGACWFDMDRDGDLDMFLANQEGDTDALYRNDSGHFTDIARDLGMDQRSRSLEDGAVGCTVGDYDNDGDLDLFVATYGTSLLYRNDDHGSFTEVGKAMGAAIEGRMVGASWGDYDNDGQLDLLVTGYTQNAQGIHPSVHLLHHDAGRFVNVLTESDALSGADHSVQWADFDRDGALDLSVTNTHTQEGIQVLRGELTKDLRGRSLEIAVLNKNGHATRAGSEVRVYDPSGKLLGMRIVDTGDGYNAQSVQPVHFGLPRNMRVTVEVRFLTATGSQTQRVENVDPRAQAGKALIVREPDAG